jgi:hypothetical protein
MPVVPPFPVAPAVPSFPPAVLPPAPVGWSVDPAHAPSARSANSDMALPKENFIGEGLPGSTVVPIPVGGNIRRRRSKKQRVQRREKKRCFDARKTELVCARARFAAEQIAELVAVGRDSARAIMTTSVTSW